VGTKNYDVSKEDRGKGVVAYYSRDVLCGCGTVSKFVFRRVFDGVETTACSQECAEQKELATGHVDLDVKSARHATRAKFKVN
jgi:hypothetical protein